jgi:hypothetical protein
VYLNSFSTFKSLNICKEENIKGVIILKWIFKKGDAGHGMD